MFTSYDLLTQGHKIDEAVLKAFDFRVQIRQGDLDLIPKSGSVLVVGNHPFGIVDGIVISSMLRKVRSDLRVMAHQGVSDISIFSNYFLPINFSGTREASRINRSTIKLFKSHLSNGGAGVIFPAGSVSTRLPLWKKNCDLPWFPSAAKWAREFNSKVVPVFVDGACGPLFQLASQFSTTLRLGSLLHENLKLIDSEIGIRIGEPIDLSYLPSEWSHDELTSHFRKKCYGLAGLDSLGKKISTEENAL